MFLGFGPKPVANEEPEPEWTLEWTLNAVEQWRFDLLTNAGWGHLDAIRLALDLALDLHRACDLLKGGCDPDLALEILT